nr:MAG TPA: hypothetical protein [Caudoviricetes sp.]
MYFENSVGKVYIENNTVVCKDSLALVKVTPWDRSNVQNLFEYYVAHFKNLELLETDPKRYKEMFYDDDI